MANGNQQPQNSKYTMVGFQLHLCFSVIRRGEFCAPIQLYCQPYSLFLVLNLRQSNGFYCCLSKHIIERFSCDWYHTSGYNRSMLSRFSSLQSRVCLSGRPYVSEFYTCLPRTTPFVLKTTFVRTFFSFHARTDFKFHFSQRMAQIFRYTYQVQVVYVIFSCFLRLFSCPYVPTVLGISHSLS